MTNGALVLLFALEFEYQDLVAAAVGGDLTTDTSGLYGIAEGQAVVSGNRQNAIKFNWGADLANKRIDINGLAGRNTVLLSARFNYSVHNDNLFCGLAAPGRNT